MIIEDDSAKPLRIPEELVDIVVTDNLVVILLFPDEFAIHYFISLIPNKPVQRLDDSMKVDALWDRINSTLTLGTPIVIVGALEYEAQALGDKAHIPSFAPAQKVKSNLPETIVLAHVVHGVAPPVEGRVKRLFSAGSFNGLKALETGVL